MGTCAQAFKGLPDTCLDGNGLILPSGIAFATIGQEFATIADAGDDDNWKTEIINKKLTFVHGIKEIEDTSGDDAIYESPGQDKTFLFSGKKSLIFSLYATIDEHKVLKTYNGKKGRLYMYDRANNLIGTTDGTKFFGAKLGYIRVHDLVVPTDASPAFTRIEIQVADNADWNERVHIIKPTEGTVSNRWYPSDMPYLSTVKVEEVGTISANLVTFDVYSSSESVTDNDGNPIDIKSVDDLDVATFTNFVFTDGSSIVTPTSMTDDGIVDGKARYTATFTAFTSGTVKISPTVNAPYESEVTTLT